MKFAKEARPFVFPFVVLAALFFARKRPRWGLGSALLGLATLLFFRDPARRPGGGEEVVLAPADGLVTGVDVVTDPALGSGRYHRVVTFLSVFDVHVQRTPVAGEVIFSGATPGRKVAAFRQDAGTVNASHLTVIRRPGGDLVGVRQIVGLLARRIVCYLHAGDDVPRGQLLGLIKFGSRVDLLVPEDYQLLVQKGDRVQNGATPMARTKTAARSPGPDTAQAETT